MNDYTLSTPNSPNFNERNWIASREALAFANAPQRTLAKVAASAVVIESVAPSVTGPATRLALFRNPVTDAEIETAKVVNREEPTDTKAAELLGLATLTVKALRATCKARGLKGYSKAKKAALLVMLG